MASQGGGLLLFQVLHHSRLINAPSSDVGSCWYCADHLPTGISALIASNSSCFQNSGHNGLPEGIIAGNSMTSHSSEPILSADLLMICPVRSLFDHLVITMMIAPPGCRRCLGPDVYHSYTLSYTSGLNCPCWASCSL